MKTNGANNKRIEWERERETVVSDHVSSLHELWYEQLFCVLYAHFAYSSVYMWGDFINKICIYIRNDIREKWWLEWSFPLCKDFDVCALLLFVNEKLAQDEEKSVGINGAFANNSDFTV